MSRSERRYEGRWVPFDFDRAHMLNLVAGTRLPRNWEIGGRALAFEAVRERIVDYLQEASWRRAASQYIGLLAGAAAIEGVEMNGFDTPLVQ